MFRHPLAGAILLAVACLPTAWSRAAAPSFPAQAVTLSFSAPTAAPGQSFDVEILATDLTGLNVTAFNVVVAFDTTRLAFKSVSLDGTLSGPDHAGLTLVYNAGQPGSIGIVAAGVNAIAGSGALVRLRFEARESGTAGLDFTSIQLNEGDPSANGTSGSVLIRPLLYGDATQNGEVSAYDAARILQHASEAEPIVGEGLEASDVSGNGSVSAFDAALVLQFVAGTRVCFPADGTCDMGKQAGTAEVSLSWHPASYRSGDARLALVATTAVGALYALTVTVDELETSTIETAKSNGSSVLRHVTRTAGGISATIASASPIASDTLFLLNHIPPALTIRLQANEQPATTAVVAAKGEIPSAFQLGQNYPNPFNPSTRIAYALPASAHVRIVLYDVLGRQVRVLVDAPQPAGAYVATLDGSGLPSGRYFYRLEAGPASATRQAVLLK
jgi:hypothetical protein